MLHKPSNTLSETRSNPCARMDRFRAIKGDFTPLSAAVLNLSPSESFRPARSAYASCRPSATTPCFAFNAQSGRSAAGIRSSGTFSEPAQHQDLLSKVGPQSLFRLRDDYSATWRTGRPSDSLGVWKSDQPTDELYVWLGDKRKRVSFYGDLRRDEEARRTAPADFLRAFDTIVRFSTQARPWLPERIEILLWPYDYSPEQPAPWPDGWPDFSQARPIGNGDMRQVLLPSAQLTALRALLGSLGERQAVALGGHKWAVAYRFPFPQEDAWMR